MDVIICEPNVPPYTKSIIGNYDNLREIIGNDVTALGTSNPNIVVICDLKMYGHRKKTDVTRLKIPGTFLFVGRDKNKLRSLSIEEMNEIINTIRKEDLTVIQ